MTVKQTFAFLKPQNAYIMDLILNRLVSEGFKILEQKNTMLDRNILSEHYSEHVEKPFYERMATYLLSDPVMLLRLERADDKDPIQTLRDLIGPTDPKKGVPGQIRHDFGAHDTTIFVNAIHASGTQEEAEEEIKRFFH